MYLNATAADIVAINKSNGWNVTTPEDWKNFPKLRTVGMLIISEIAEALEAFRKRDGENLAEELADVSIRCMDCDGGLGVDIEQFVGGMFDLPPGRVTIARMAHYAAGSYGGDLAKEVDADWRLPTAKELDDNPYALPSYLFAMSRSAADAIDGGFCGVYFSDVLTMSAALAHRLGFDHSADIAKKMDRNRSRGFRHGGKVV